jgi:hypothetical protein
VAASAGVLFFSVISIFAWAEAEKAAKNTTRKRMVDRFIVFGLIWSR